MVDSRRAVVQYSCELTIRKIVCQVGFAGQSQPQKLLSLGLLLEIIWVSSLYVLLLSVTCALDQVSRSASRSIVQVARRLPLSASIAWSANRISGP